MSKIATMRQSARQANEQAAASLAETADRIIAAAEELKTAPATIEAMAQRVEPLAQSLADLSDETRRTLTLVVQQSEKGHKAAVAKLTKACDALTLTATNLAKDLRSSAKETEKRLMDSSEATANALEELKTAASSINRRIMMLSLATSLLTTPLAVASWLWLQPYAPQNYEQMMEADCQKGVKGVCQYLDQLRRR